MQYSILAVKFYFLAAFLTKSLFFCKYFSNLTFASRNYPIIEQDRKAFWFLFYYYYFLIINFFYLFYK